MGKFTFRKSERLNREKHIQELFAKGSSFYLFPFKVYTLLSPQAHSPHQVVISVLKRNFKRAVDRNLLKRRIREAYRTQKIILESNSALLIAFVYTHKEALSFEDINKKIKLCLVRISEFSKKSDKSS